MQIERDKIRVKEAIRYFGLSESFLRHAIMKRQIPHYKLGRATFISIKEVEKLIEEGRIEAR